MDDDFNKFFFTDSGGYIRWTDCEDFTTLNNVCGFLITIGADIECCNGYGKIALLAAARSDFNASTLWLQVLVVNGANCFAKDDDRRGPLHMLLRKERFLGRYTSKPSPHARPVRPRLVTLLQAGCSPCQRDDQGRTPSDYTRETRIVEVWKEALSEMGYAGW